MSQLSGGEAPGRKTGRSWRGFRPALGSGAAHPMWVPRPLRAAVLLAGCWQVQGEVGCRELRGRAVSRGGDGGPLLGVFVKDKQYEGLLSPLPPHNTHTHTRTKSRMTGMVMCTHGQTHGAPRPVSTETVDVRKDACALTDVEPQTCPGCAPTPHLEEGFPARCSYHAPNKSQLIRTLPLNWSPSLCSDQISRQGRKRKSPLFLLLRLLLCCCSTQRGCLGACAPSRPTAPPLNHTVDHRLSDRLLLRFGFQPGGAAAPGSQAGAPTPGPDGPIGGPLLWGSCLKGPGWWVPPSLIGYPPKGRPPPQAPWLVVLYFCLM